MKRALFGAAVVAVGLLANGLMACGKIIRYPSCGDWVLRARDGATCRECLDGKGRYAECGRKVLEKE